MKIESVTIENFRGITAWDADFNGQNTRILGPNGSGKSSVIQAIEFLLTGGVSQLRGKGTQYAPFREYASHIRADPRDARVQATFREPGEGTVTIERDVSEPEEANVVRPTETDELPEWLRRQMDVAKLGYSVLDRDRLLKFVTAPEGKRGDAIDELFQLEGVDDIRTGFKTAARRYKGTVEERASAKREASKRLFALFPDGVNTRREARKEVNSIRRNHGEPTVESLDEDFTITRSANIVLQDDVGKWDYGTQQLVDEIQDWLENNRHEILATESNLRENVARFEESEHTTRALDSLDLIERGLSLIDQYNDACPLCQRHWDSNDLQTELEARKERSIALQNTRNQIEQQSGELRNKLTRYRDNLEQLANELPENKSAEISTITEAVENISELLEKLRGGSLTEIPPVPADSETSEPVLFPQVLAETLEELQRDTEPKHSDVGIDSSISKLGGIAERYDDLVRKEKRLKDAEAVMATLDKIEQSYLEAREQVLAEVFSKIETKFEDYYQAMHQDEEASDFSARLEPTNTGVRFEPGFYDEGHHNPNAVHSEGHRDSMGLALFLAMSDVGGEGIDILLLDDVIMSIDSQHRSNIANLLSDNISDDYQIVLTTHDKTWDRHLKLTQGFPNSIRFSKCSLAAGPHEVGSISDPWSRIDHHIENDDVTAAAAWIRKTVEWYARRTCKNLQADVPYHHLEDESLNPNTLYQRALQWYEDLLENGCVTAETDYDERDIERDKRTVAGAKRKKSRHLNLLNSNIHHNEAEAAFYTGTELTVERDVFRSAYELFRCEDCGSWIKDGRRGVYCYCGTQFKT